MWKLFKSAFILLVLCTILTGLIYPLFITGIAQLFFHHQANGSLIKKNGAPIGSALVSQNFSSPKYFWGRLSATSPYPNNATGSTASNLSPTNPAWIAAVKARIAALHAADPTNDQPIPIDLVTASGSGLDPDISVAAALYQAPRVAAARHLSESIVETLIANATTERQFRFLGEARVNVLQLNLALDELSHGHASQS